MSMYKSIENKPAVDESADTPLLKEEVVKRIFDLWVAHADVSLFDLMTLLVPPGGWPHPISDRDYLHALENYWNGRNRIN